LKHGSAKGCRLLVREIEPCGTAVEVFNRFSAYGRAFFLDSGIRSVRIGRYSYLGCEPFQVLASHGKRIDVVSNGTHRVEHDNPFHALRLELNRIRVDPHPDLPFSCGAVGFLGYGLGSHLERLPRTTLDDIGFPDMEFGFYDRIVAFDHEAGRVWTSAAELPGVSGSCEEKIEDLLSKLSGAELPAETGPATRAGIRCNFTRGEYLRAVQTAKDYVAAGDIFQVNLSQRFQTRLAVSPAELYRRLRSINPAPYAAYLDCDGHAVVSASPELFLRVHGRRVETRPIKGTRPRGSRAEEDERLRAELLASDKDAAELAMIVDLERNDLGRVCSYGTVRVSEPRVLECYPTVWHGVATVEGTLHDPYDRIDLLKATFPGGSVTGAPKIRAMEIIDELEPTSRSVYTGSIGSIGFDGGMNLNIAIRTFLVRGKDAFFQVGGGIVADSGTADEYDETLHKARALIESLGASVSDLNHRAQ